MCDFMEWDKKPLDFAEIDMKDEPAQDGAGLRSLAIPQRKEPPVVERIPFVKALSREKQFVQQARALEERRGEPAPFVPFMSYWPTYEQMSEAQRSWYFYWRSEVRGGQYLFTDLSYVFVYLYELIHGIGWQDPKQGYALWMGIWEAYGTRYPKLNAYLADWVCDFVLVHHLDIPLMDILSRSDTARTHELFDLELSRLLRENPASLTFGQVMTLSDYDMQRSKFYQDGGSALMEEYVPKVLAIVDSYMQKTTGKTLVDTFYKGPGKTIERYLFRSAIYDASLYGRTFAMRLDQVRKCAPLRYYITQLVRSTENKLRELRHFKGRLRGVSLKSETETLIQRYLEREYQAAKPVLPAISIDAEKLALLQRDSEDVRSMLTVEAWEDEPDSQDQEVSDPDMAVGKEGWTHDAPFQGMLDEALPNSDVDVERLPEDPSFEWKTTGLDEDWTQFAEQLGQAHLEVLYALKSHASAHELELIAEMYGTMPELLLDEINGIAMETIGDLVIDGERLSEEYENYFESLTR